MWKYWTQWNTSQECGRKRGVTITGLKENQCLRSQGEREALKVAKEMVCAVMNEESGVMDESQEVYRLRKLYEGGALPFDAED